MELLYPYIIIYFGVIIEGELALLTSTLAAQRGMLNFGLVTITAFMGTLTIDWLLFFGGKYFGVRLFHKFTKLNNQTAKPMIWIRNNPTWILISYRYLYGFRIVTLLILGMSNVPVKKFMVYSLVSIIIWTVLFSFLGYYLGELVSTFITQIENVLLYLVSGFLSAILILFLIKSLMRKVL